MPKRATDVFAFTFNDAIVVVDGDAVYADDHPWVKANPSKFKEVEHDVIEAATQAPGEVRRGPGRPKKVKDDDIEVVAEPAPHKFGTVTP